MTLYPIKNSTYNFNSSSPLRICYKSIPKVNKKIKGESYANQSNLWKSKLWGKMQRCCYWNLPEWFTYSF